MHQRRQHPPGSAWRWLSGCAVGLVLIIPGVARADDPLRCGGRAVTITGTAASEPIHGTPGDDVIHGLGGDDVIDGGSGADVICGGAGDDVLLGRTGADVLMGGMGDDRIEGHDGNDVLGGGPGDDRLNGWSGADRLSGHGGDDHLTGGSGPDVLSGGAGSDDLRGGPGPDLVAGGGGADLLDGGRGADRLVGGAGWDRMTGGEGTDTLTGGDGGDTMHGGPGDDLVSGGGHDDHLDGAGGRDVCRGGTGLDHAVGCEEPIDTETGQRAPPVTTPGPAAVALTFDDGPDPAFTPLILDALDRLGIRATFFVMGSKAERHPDLVRDMIARGHSVQNHTCRHSWLTRYPSEAAANDIRCGIEVITALTGITPQCLRPPFGAVNDRIRAVAAAEDQAVVMWDVDTRDWDGPSSATIARRALAAQGGDTILFHEGGGGWRTLGALDTIAAGFAARGIAFETLCG